MTKEQKLYRSLILADLRVITLLANSSNKADKLLAGYHMQQAIEKTIKLKAELLGVNCPLIHNIRSLLNYCKQYKINLDVPRLIQKNCDMYSSWETRGRYDPTSVIRWDSIWAAYRVTLAWLNSGVTMI